MDEYYMEQRRKTELKHVRSNFTNNYLQFRPSSISQQARNQMQKQNRHIFQPGAINSTFQSQNMVMVRKGRRRRRRGDHSAKNYRNYSQGHNRDNRKVIYNSNKYGGSYVGR